MVNKNDLGEADVKIVKDLLEKVKPDQMFVAGDLADPHGTHRVCLNAVLAAIDEGKIAAYISDFADEAMLANNKVVCLPHLGASTPEAEDNCAKMAVKQVMAFMEEGTITNSVNFPKCRMDEPVPQNGARLAIANKNVPNMIGQITSVLAANKLNISSMANQNRNDVAYNLIDVETPVSGDVVNSLLGIDGVIAVRVISAEAE